MTFKSALRILLLTALPAVCASLVFAGEVAAQPEAKTPETGVKAGTADPAELLLNIANFRTLRTKFVQTKHLKAFKKPMVGIDKLAAVELLGQHGETGRRLARAVTSGNDV